MRIRTDDEVYRVDAVWLGPPRATFPWRARYASYAVGLVVMVAVMFAQRRLGISLGFFSVAWALMITVAVTRFVGHRIDEDRPLFEWLTLFLHELRGPRRVLVATGSALDAGHVRVGTSPRRPARAAEVAGVEVAGAEAADAKAAGAEAGFGPPSAATVGAADRPRSGRALAAAAGPAASAAADVAAWSHGRSRRSRTGPREPVRVASERATLEGAEEEGDGAAP